MNTYTKLGVWANCRGLNHADRGEIVIHDRCGAEVVKREDGKVFEVQRVGIYKARKFECYTKQHECNPVWVELEAKKVAQSVAEGNIEKGCTVVVVKGRKVPKGTTGVVFWKGIDGYGTAKLGFRTAEGEPHWTAESNCQLV